MKIALSTTMIQGGRSGVAQYVFSLLRSLIPHAQHHEFHLLVLENDIPLFEFAQPHMTLVPVPEKWRSPVRSIFWHQTLLPRWIRQHQIDVLHVPSYRRMVLNAPCRTVSTIHDLAPFHVQGKYDPARMLYGRVVVKKIARQQEAIIAISSNTRQDIQQYFGIPEMDQHLILNGLDHQRFSPGDPVAARERVRQRWSLDRPFFLYVSRLEHPAKNHVRLIEAFTQFRRETGSDWELVLAGSDWHGASQIREAAHQSAAAEHIRFLGFVEDDILPDLYRAAGTMVYPSLFEGFGLPPVEAMACGCPVISSLRGSLEEVVGHAADPIDPDQPASIAAALTRVATDSTHRDALRERGFQNARRFDWDRNAEQVMAVYQGQRAAA